MQTPTMPKYHEQERKIHEAYIKDEIKPYNANFCFCGTLSVRKDGKWCDNTYSYEDFTRMEYALLYTIMIETFGGNDIYFVKYALGNDNNERIAVINHHNYEEALFNGMVKALEVLRQIHEEKGELIDTEPIFQKRKLTQSCNPQ